MQVNGHPSGTPLQHKSVQTGVVCKDTTPVLRYQKTPVNGGEVSATIFTTGITDSTYPGVGNIFARVLITRGIFYTEI